MAGSALKVAGVILVVKGLAEFQKGLAAAANAQADFTKQIDSMGKAMIGLGEASATLLFGMAMTTSRIEELSAILEVTRKNAVSLAQQQAAEAANVYNFAKQQHDLATASELTSMAVQGEVEAIRKLHLQGQVANEIVAEMIRYDLDWTKASELARMAQDAATYAMQDSSQAMQGLIQGIVTLQPRVLRTYGIMVNLNIAYEKWAKTNDIAVESMTVAQRQQAALNAVLEQAPNIAGAYEAAMGTASKQIRSLKTDTIDLSEAYGQFLTPALDKGVSGLRAFMHGLASLPAPMRAYMATMAATATGMLVLEGSVLRAWAAIRKVKEAMEKLAVARGLTGGWQAGLGAFMTGPAGIASMVAMLVAATAGIVAARKAAVEAHKAEAAQIAASVESYGQYILKLQQSKDAAYALTEQLWKLVQAQEASAREGYAKAIADAKEEMERMARTLRDQAINDAFLAMSDDAQQAADSAMTFIDSIKQGAPLNEFQLAVLKDADSVALLGGIMMKESGSLEQWATDLAFYVAREENANKERIAAVNGTRELLKWGGEARAEQQLGIDSTVDASVAYARLANQLGLTVETVAEVVGELGLPAEKLKELVEVFGLSEKKILDVADALTVNKDELYDMATASGISADSLQELVDSGMNEAQVNDYADAIKELGDAMGITAQAAMDMAMAQGMSLQQVQLLTAQTKAETDAVWAELDAMLKRNQELEDLDVELGQRQRDLALEKARELADIDAQLADEHAAINQRILDLDLKLAHDQIDAATDREQKLADLEDKLKQDQADAWQDFQWDLEDAARDHNERLAEIQQDLYDDLADLQRDFNVKAAELEEERLKDEEDIRQKYKEARIQELIRLGYDEEQVRNNWNDDMMQGPLKDQMEEELGQLQENYDDKLGDLQDQLAREREEREREFQQQLAEEQTRYDREREERKREYDRRLQELQQQHEREEAEAWQSYDRKMADLQLQYDRERAKIIDELEKEREEIIKKYDEQAADLAQWYKDRVAEIQREYDKQREEIKLQLQLTNLKAQEEFGKLPEFFQPVYDELLKQAEEQMGLWSKEILDAVNDVQTELGLPAGEGGLGGAGGATGAPAKGPANQGLMSVVPPMKAMIPAQAMAAMAAGGTTVNTPINVGAINNGLDLALFGAIVRQAVATGMRGY